ncbi:DUF397 domain-containing protein [Actinomadura rupiterrae]|uniref:DUF397 domain-containing protein n=1 Tax=Actinomadura rupiterrae TaxID=559627 RepID=UPI0027E3735C|nr:DUF397 domain-containing protein [Actinomadura rupiterrae]
MWRKSSYSTGMEDSECVELASLPGGVGVRDSKAPRDGFLSLSRGELADVVALIRACDLG